MKEANKRIVVLSRNLYSGLSVVRSLGEAGHTIDFIANMKKAGRRSVIASSKYINKYFEAISIRAKDGMDRGVLEALVEYGKNAAEKRILLAVDDYTVFVVESNKEILEKYFYLPFVKRNSTPILDLMNRKVQTNMAKAAGLNIPMEWLIDLRSENIEIPGDMVYPCFCKPVDISSGNKKEMEMCSDEEELKKHLRRLQARFSDRDIIVQEFLEIDGEFQLAGVCLDQEIIAPVVGKTTNVAQYRENVILTGNVLSRDILEGINENIIQMLKSLNYTGMFNLELIYASGKYYFNDINFRSSRLNQAFLKSGINFPNLCVKAIAGEEIFEQEKQVEETGKTFVFEYVAWEDFKNDFITMAEYEERINSVDIGILDDSNDPNPMEIFNKNKSEAHKGTSKRKISKTVKCVKGALRPIKHMLLGYPQMKKENERDPNSKKPRVIICGRNYCSNLCMARAIGAAGYEVEILRIFQRKPRKKNIMKILKPDAYSKYVKAYHVCISRRSLVIVNRLKKLADRERKMLLIPTDDLVTHIVDEYLEDLQEYYVMPNVNNKAGEINYLMSKGVQKELALAAGIPVLGSCVIKTVEGKFNIPSTVGYPCFIKPNISKNGSKAKMRKCDNEEELRDALIELSEKKDVEMLVEDFVEIKKEYSILGISTKDGAIGPGFFGAVEGGQNEQRGVALIGQVLPCDMLGDLHETLVKFVGSLNYTGLYDIDLIETMDGKMYFVELNMRYGGSGYSIVASGLNLPGMFADYMLSGVPIDMNAKLENTGKKFLSEKIMIEEYIKGRITRKKLNESMANVDIHFIMDENDPKPYSHFKKFYSVATVKRTLDAAKNK